MVGTHARLAQDIHPVEYGWEHLDAQDEAVGPCLSWVIYVRSGGTSLRIWHASVHLVERRGKADTGCWA